MRFVLSALLATSVLVAARGDAVEPSRPPLTCSTVALRTRVLSGESLILRYSVRNPGTVPVFLAGEEPWGVVQIWKRVSGGDWRTSDGWPPDGIPVGDPKFYEFKPREEHREMRLVMRGMEDTPGLHEVQVRMHYYRWPYPAKLPAGAWAGILECTPAQIEVVEPTGVDKEVFDARGPYPLSGGGKITIVEKYPTSIYAGYVLLGSSSFESTPSSTLLRGEDNRRGPASQSAAAIARRAYQIERDDRLAHMLLSGLEAFLGAHPDFPLRAWLEAKRAGLLAYFERYEEARALARKALAEEENPMWQEEGRRFLDLLVKKGYVKPE